MPNNQSLHTPRVTTSTQLVPTIKHHKPRQRHVSVSAIRRWEMAHEIKSDSFNSSVSIGPEDYADVDRYVRGERALWRAVITQALMDAASESKKYEVRLEREKARRWLLAAGPDFCTVCHYAGLEPSVVHRRVRKALAGGCQWRSLPEMHGKQTNRR